jgi:olefin beta-lactone synthetase
VISAGAPATPAVLARFTQLLPKTVQVFTPYGATESLPVANIGSHEILQETRPLTDSGHGVCLGQPVNGIRVAVVSITDDSIPEWQDSLTLPTGQIGEFVVRGPVVTPGYFRKPEATRLAKIRDSQNGELLHRMGDVGYVDERGRLWFCGRKSHRVVTPEGTMFTDMVEPIFNTVPGVRRTALVSVRRDGRAFPVLCVELDGTKTKAEVLVGLKTQTQDRERRSVSSPVSSTIQDRRTDIAPLAELRTFLFHPLFPMDVRHNSKIFREKLAVWADRQLGVRWKGGES